MSPSLGYKQGIRLASVSYTRLPPTIDDKTMEEKEKRIHVSPSSPTTNPYPLPNPSSSKFFYSLSEKSSHPHPAVLRVF